MTEELRILVRYRFGRAREALEEADVIFRMGHTNSSMNRLYYAAFYAASAALLARGFSAGKHAGIRALFHREPVKTGVVPMELGRLFDGLFDSRQKGDYVDLVCFEPSDVERWLAPTRRLVDVLEAAEPQA